MRRVILPLCVLALGVEMTLGQMATVIQEDFEVGLGAWNTQVAQPDPPELNGAPIIFTAADPLLYTNTGNPGSHSAGFSSDLPAYDGSLAAWMEKRLVDAVPPGTYIVRLVVDAYVYKDPDYRLPAPPDPWAVGNRIYVLTNASCDDQCLNFDGGMPADVGRKSYWPGLDESAPSLYSGQWRLQQVAIDNKTMTTTTGTFALRLMLHDKYQGKQAVAWDNLVLTITDASNPANVFAFTEDFESGLAGWTVKTFEADRPHDDTPTVFTTADTRLVTNTGNPGSNSGGFASDLTCVDNTRGTWLYRQFLNLWPPGDYSVAIEADAYVYKDPLGAFGSDPQALGARILVLTDDNYNNPGFQFETASPSPGFSVDLWSGDGLGSVNGVWQHVSVLVDMTTTTGSFEIRLLEQDKFENEPLFVAEWSKTLGKQAVGWDNVRVRIGPACYDPRFDRDGDDDVDMDDFAVYQQCFTGPGATGGLQNFEVCRCMNSDGDTDIDRDDFAAFQACASGAGVPAGADCDNALSPP